MILIFVKKIFKLKSMRTGDRTNAKDLAPQSEFENLHDASTRDALLELVKQVEKLNTSTRQLHRPAQIPAQPEEAPAQVPAITVDEEIKSLTELADEDERQFRISVLRSMRQTLRGRSTKTWVAEVDKALRVLSLTDENEVVSAHWESVTVNQFLNRCNNLSEETQSDIEHLFYTFRDEFSKLKSKKKARNQAIAALDTDALDLELNSGLPPPSTENLHTAELTTIPRDVGVRFDTVWRQWEETILPDLRSKHQKCVDAEGGGSAGDYLDKGPAMKEALRLSGWWVRGGRRIEKEGGKSVIDGGERILVFQDPDRPKDFYYMAPYSKKVSEIHHAKTMLKTPANGITLTKLKDAGFHPDCGEDSYNDDYTRETESTRGLKRIMDGNEKSLSMKSEIEKAWNKQFALAQKFCLQEQFQKISAGMKPDGGTYRLPIGTRVKILKSTYARDNRFEGWKGVIKSDGSVYYKVEFSSSSNGNPDVQNFPSNQLEEIVEPLQNDNPMGISNQDDSNNTSKNQFGHRRQDMRILHGDAFELLSFFLVPGKSVNVGEPHKLSVNQFKSDPEIHNIDIQGVEVRERDLAGLRKVATYLQATGEANTEYSKFTQKEMLQVILIILDGCDKEDQYGSLFHFVVHVIDQLGVPEELRNRKGVKQSARQIGPRNKFNLS